MAFTKENLAKAQMLCSREGDKKISSMKGRSGASSSYLDDDIGYLNESQMRNINPVQNFNNTSRSIDSLNIPDVIKQSFLNESIDVSSLADPTTKNIRAFDDIVESFAREASPSPQPIQEDRMYYQTNNNGIDYNVIRQIIEECIDRKLKNLNENVLKGIRLKEGKISLSAHNGNVYQANLEYKGNINEQKKKNA
jgi:hypothetical protein